MEKRTVTIDFGELEMAMQDQSMIWCIDPATGMACLEPEEAASLYDADDAELMKSTDPDDVLALPPYDSSDGYRMMERFAESLDDPKASETLLDALDRPKPFRRFKDALSDFPEIRSAWFEYQSEQLRKFAEDYYVHIPAQREHPIRSNVNT